MALQLTRSLLHRNLRLYFLGQLLSLHGTWMQSVAQAWLVYRLTDSSFMLGLVSFLNLMPVLVLGLITGAVADRYSRFRLFWITQALAMLQAFLLGALTLIGHVQVVHILVLAITLGIMGWIWTGSIRVEGGGTATPDFNIGVADATHASDADSIAQSAFFHPTAAASTSTPRATTARTRRRRLTPRSTTRPARRPPWVFT